MAHFAQILHEDVQAMLRLLELVEAFRLLCALVFQILLAEIAPDFDEVLQNDLHAPVVGRIRACFARARLRKEHIAQS